MPKGSELVADEESDLRPCPKLTASPTGPEGSHNEVSYGHSNTQHPKQESVTVPERQKWPRPMIIHLVTTQFSWTVQRLGWLDLVCERACE